MPDLKIPPLGLMPVPKAAFWDCARAEDPSFFMCCRTPHQYIFRSPPPTGSLHNYINIYLPVNQNTRSHIIVRYKTIILNNHDIILLIRISNGMPYIVRYEIWLIIFIICFSCTYLCRFNSVCH